jgi:N-acetyl-anhydromuramyl-L-alanine amidase AmpD
MNLVQNFLTENPCYKANMARADSRYTAFQDRGPSGLMLHSVGCAQPNAEVFVKNWNKASYTAACVHAFIDANTGTVYQCLPWNYRGWHAGNQIGNNTLIGVEMCESGCIKYPSSGGVKFTVLDAEKAQADCTRAYDAAVELFADLCTRFALNPETAILSHKEGGIRGIASGHVDPEHYWQGLGMSYTMDGFRADVKKLVEAGKAEDVQYRVQVGAFCRKDYAEAYLEQVRKIYPQAFLVKG